jgi:rfaE bifunctional protein kinase chain/domain
MFDKEKISELFNSFNKLNVLIIGDVMVDSYLWGDVDRISPEAPVPVVNITKRENRLGGAANVALNIKSMGANPILCSVVGNDTKGDEFLSLLEKQKMETVGILKSDKRITTTKFRVIGNNMQLLRVDEEIDSFLEEIDRKKLFETFIEISREKKIDVIVFQDYDKGIIDEELISRVVEKAGELGIPVAVDPKRRNFLSYKGVTLFKPNLKELSEGLKIEIDRKNRNKLKDAVSKLKSKINADIVMITLSEDGIFVEFNDNGEKEIRLFPSYVRAISDVSGAGDTVISVASLCLAAGSDAATMANIANLAGGLVCEEVGVVPVDKEELLRETLKLEM